jgi:hypothetical protein
MGILLNPQQRKSSISPEWVAQSKRESSGTGRKLESLSPENAIDSNSRDALKATKANTMRLNAIATMAAFANQKKNDGKEKEKGEEDANVDEKPELPKPKSFKQHGLRRSSKVTFCISR